MLKCFPFTFADTFAARLWLFLRFFLRQMRRHEILINFLLPFLTILSFYFMHAKIADMSAASHFRFFEARMGFVGGVELK